MHSILRREPGDNYGGSLASRTRDYNRNPLGHPGNRQEDYETLTPEQKATLGRWIEGSFKKLKNPPRTGPADSYALKHYFEDSDEGFYITNGQFKGAMMWAGHNPVNEQSINWTFRAKLVQDRRAD